MGIKTQRGTTLIDEPAFAKALCRGLAHFFTYGYDVPRFRPGLVRCAVRIRSSGNAPR